ncbi:pirin family protein [Brachymonas sp.]|uniref:pirin family protein n=1 Tax=Brachymonas sp. TaxID=1936292 RepID=UPI0035B4E292
MTDSKRIVATRRAPARHWVGDGFPVHGMFDYNGAQVPARSPFLLLDYAAPCAFEPHTGYRRGVGQHPHRGFETVTLVYDGEVEHRDSAGGGGVIGKGDVQWMTAGAGLMHEEFHSERYSRTGGPFEMIQLWVNLPARDKMTPPRYQAITADRIPEVALPGGAGTMRLVAGEFAGQQGPALTHTPMRVWDVTLAAGATVSLPQPEGWTTLLVVRSGELGVQGQATLEAAEMATLTPEGTDVTLQAHGDADVHLLLLSGEPIDEPVVGYGPFVMNTREEIVQAIDDLQQGRFGRMDE